MLATTALVSLKRVTSVTVTADELVTDVLASKSVRSGIGGTTTETENEVKGSVLGDVVVRESVGVFELLTVVDKTLLFRRNTFLFLDLGLNV